MPSPAPHSLADVLARLQTERVLRLDAGAWASVADAFVIKDRHATGLAGDLLVAETTDDGSALVGVDTPETGEVYVRLFVDEAEANAWVKRRLAQYERMWDG